jgi:hypothetical protein
LNWSSEVAGRPFALIRFKLLHVDGPASFHNTRIGGRCTSPTRALTTSVPQATGCGARRRVSFPELPDSTQVQPRNATTCRKRPTVAMPCFDINRRWTGRMPNWTRQTGFEKRRTGH